MTTFIDHVTEHKETMQEIVIAILNQDDEPLFTAENVFALAPAKLDSIQLPAFYPLTSQATYDESKMGELYIEATRVYRLQVPVIPVGQATPEVREALCPPLIQAIVETFNGYPTLNNTPFVRAKGSKVLSDSGIVVLPEWGAKYVGFEVRLQVIYDMPRVYAQGE